MNIVGEGFHKNINNQIRQRQKVHGSGYDQNFRTPEQITYLNANSSWCRLVSGTDIKNVDILNNPSVKYIGLTGNELARRFVLFNGSSHYPLNSPIFRSGFNAVFGWRRQRGCRRAGAASSREPGIKE